MTARWGYAEYRAGSSLIHFCTTLALFVGERSPVSLCRSNSQRYTSNSVVTQITRFIPTPALSKSILSNAAEPFGLYGPERCKLYVKRKEKWREPRTGKKMRGCCGNTMRQMRERDRGRKRETRGNTGRQEERHCSNDLGFFVCMSVM